MLFPKGTCQQYGPAGLYDLLPDEAEVYCHLLHTLVQEPESKNARKSLGHSDKLHASESQGCAGGLDGKVLDL